MNPIPKNKLQAAAFEWGMKNENQFRKTLAPRLKISEITLRAMWQNADASKHYYPTVKKVAGYFGKNVEDLFIT